MISRLIDRQKLNRIKLLELINCLGNLSSINTKHLLLDASEIQMFNSWIIIK